jgi:hypothetical protein
MSVISSLIRHLETWNRIKTSKGWSIRNNIRTIVASLYRSVVYSVIYVGHAANIRLNLGSLPVFIRNTFPRV